MGRVVHAKGPAPGEGSTGAGPCWPHSTNYTSAAESVVAALCGRWSTATSFPLRVRARERTEPRGLRSAQRSLPPGPLSFPLGEPRSMWPFAEDGRDPITRSQSSILSPQPSVLSPQQLSSPCALASSISYCPPMRARIATTPCRQPPPHARSARPAAAHDASTRTSTRTNLQPTATTRRDALTTRKKTRASHDPVLRPQSFIDRRLRVERRYSGNDHAVARAHGADGHRRPGGRGGRGRRDV